MRGVVCGNCKMARNSEKRLSGLNRFLEAKETEKNSKLKRPPLCRLSTADDVKGWIPSIQKEINHLLKQIEGTGSRKHNDTNIKEFHTRIEHLQQEHKRFVAKVRALDPTYRDVMPWQPRAYCRKRVREGGGGKEEEDKPQNKKLFSPLLTQEDNSEPSRKKPTSSQESQQNYFPSEHTATECAAGSTKFWGNILTYPPTTNTHSGQGVRPPTTRSGQGVNKPSPNPGLAETHTSTDGLLGLDYSSSDSSDE